MPRDTYCPSCGAPLDFKGRDDEVTCEFCGAHLEVHADENGQPQFRLLDAPEPQSDVLSRPVEAAGRPEPDAPAGEPVAPGYISGIPDDASVEAASPTNIGANIYGGATDAAETPAHYQIGNEAQTARPAGPARWIYIAGAVFVVACLMCACVAGAMIALQNGGINF